MAALMQRLAVLVLAVALTLTSCTTHETSAPTVTSAAPTVEERTYRWIPNPAVDLMSPEGTMIRAAIESADIADQSDKHGRAAYQEGYPGYADANRDPYYDRRGGLDPGHKTLRGTTYYEVITLTRTGTIYTANVCEYVSATAERSGTEYLSRNAGLGNSLSVTFGPDSQLSAERQEAPPPDQKGPARSPTDNVFGTWVVKEVAALGGRFPECNKLAPGTPEQRTFPYVWPAPPPVLPPDPGWPDSGAA